MQTIPFLPIIIIFWVYYYLVVLTIQKKSVICRSCDIFDTYFVSQVCCYLHPTGVDWDKCIRQMYIRKLMTRPIIFLETCLMDWFSIQIIRWPILFGSKWESTGRPENGSQCSLEDVTEHTTPNIALVANVAVALCPFFFLAVAFAAYAAAAAAFPSFPFLSWWCVDVAVCFVCSPPISPSRFTLSEQIVAFSPLIYMLYDYLQTCVSRFIHIIILYGDILRARGIIIHHHRDTLGLRLNRSLSF